MSNAETCVAFVRRMNRNNSGYFFSERYVPNSYQYVSPRKGTDHPTARTRQKRQDGIHCCSYNPADCSSAERLQDVSAHQSANRLRRRAAPHSSSEPLPTFSSTIIPNERAVNQSSMIRTTGVTLPNLYKGIAQQCDMASCH